MNACVFADCNSVKQQMAAVAGDVYVVGVANSLAEQHEDSKLCSMGSHWSLIPPDSIHWHLIGLLAVYNTVTFNTAVFFWYRYTAHHYCAEEGTADWLTETENDHARRVLYANDGELVTLNVVTKYCVQSLEVSWLHWRHSASVSTGDHPSRWSFQHHSWY